MSAQDGAFIHAICEGIDLADSTQLHEQLTQLHEQLLKVNEPIFAVLDGAQFDDLPSSLLDGDFVHKPLYKPDNVVNRDQIRTAPQLVWLDHAAVTTIRPRDITSIPRDGKINEEILDRLFTLIGDKPAAVFWQCAAGCDVLFRHLRGINMVLLPREALPLDEQRHIPESHAPALFRHADANVMSQVLPALSPELFARLLGPADAIRFVPDNVWSLEPSYAFLASHSTSAPPMAGMPRFDEAVMRDIESRRMIGVERHLMRTFAHQSQRFGDDYRHIVANAFQRAAKYGLETLEDIESFVLTEFDYGPYFELKPGHEEAHSMLRQSERPPAARVYYARRACRDAELVKQGPTGPLKVGKLENPGVV